MSAVAGADDLTAKVRELWERSQPMVGRRLEVLERAARAATEGTLVEPLRSEAGSEAHKLAGSLGMFGFQRGTELARELEMTLEGGPDAALPELVSALRSELLG